MLTGLLGYTAVSSASHDCCEFINTVEDCFLTQHVLCPTRGDTILDLVFSREPELVSDLEVINNLGDGDHNMILFTIHLLCMPTLRNCVTTEEVIL